MITPVQTATLIVGYGLWTQGYGVWKLRRTLDWRSVAPFVIGGTIGIPLGTMLLSYVDPAYLRGGCRGVAGHLQHLRLGQADLQTATRPGRGRRKHRIPERIARRADRTPGLHHHGLVPDARLNKDEQRAVFQPVILAAMIVIAISLSVTGAITKDTLQLYVLGLPMLLAGLWLGFKCYGKLDDATFRKLVLLLLLCSGLALIAAQGWPLMSRGLNRRPLNEACWATAGMDLLPDYLVRLERNPPDICLWNQAAVRSRM